MNDSLRYSLVTGLIIALLMVSVMVENIIVKIIMVSVLGLILGVSFFFVIRSDELTNRQKSIGWVLLILVFLFLLELFF